MKKSLKKVLFLLAAIMFVSSLSLNAHASSRYYSFKQLGVKNRDKLPKYKIVSVKGNTVKYKKVLRWIETEEGATVVFEKKVRSAKLTKKTRYYVGSLKKYNQESEKRYSSYTQFKWIKRVNKKVFKKKSKGWGCEDLVFLKNGKVIKIFTNMQVAG